MPRTTVTPVKAFAHCTDSFCRGNAQEAVDGVVEETHFSYVELGGDAPGIERSQTIVRFADAEQRPCSACGVDREITDQKRPRYETRVGNPDFLKQLIEQGRISQPGEVAAVGDDKIAELERKIAALTEALESKANKTGPKPKAAE